MSGALAHLAAGAQHKRKGSALDQLLEARGPASGKRASPEREAAPAAEGEPAPVQLTECCSLHLLQLRESQEGLLRKIDAITEAGTGFLDQLRAGFLQNMERIKKEISEVVDLAEVHLSEHSASTLDCQRRANMAAELIGKLNIKTVDLDQQKPAALFSAQEEGGEEGEEPGEAAEGAAAGHGL